MPHIEWGEALMTGWGRRWGGALVATIATCLFIGRGLVEFIADNLSREVDHLQSKGSYAQAIPLAQRALTLRQLAWLSKEDYALLDLARLYLAVGRSGEANPLFQRALRVAEASRGSKHPDLSIILDAIAYEYVSQRRYDEAEPLLRRSIALKEAANLSTAAPWSVLALARLHHAQGRYEEAETFYERWLAIRKSRYSHVSDDAEIQPLSDLARIKLVRGDFTGAADALQRAAVIKQERDAWLGEDRITEQETRRNWMYFDGLIKVTHRLAASPLKDFAKEARNTFIAAQWSQSSAAAAAIAQMAARSASGSPTLGALVRERQDRLAAWKEGRNLPQPPRSAEVELDMAGMVGPASDDARIYEIDKLIAKDFPDYDSLRRPQASGVEEVQAVLRDDEALVLFLDTNARFTPLPEETFIWIVTKSALHWLRSDLGTAALRREVAAMRCGLDRTAWFDQGATRCAELLKMPAQILGDNDPPPFDGARAHALYNSLLGPAADLLKGKHLLIVPSGALTTLPFQVLITEPTSNLDDPKAAWLIRDHAISVLPSVGSLLSLRRASTRSAATKPMIGFANPLLEGDQSNPVYGAQVREIALAARQATGCAEKPMLRTASHRLVHQITRSLPQTAGHVDIQHLRAQTPLPETADEICEVARSVGADLREMRIGEAATETEVKRLSASGELSQYRILHFATHGTLAGELKGTNEPGLILTPPHIGSQEDDGFLSGSEIVGLKLDADWVILSACNTAGGTGQGQAAEALSGLARAFFYAGARALLVSHWPVESNAAVKLVTGSIIELAMDKSIGRAEALRRAMLTAIADRTATPTDPTLTWHPSIWAPFVVVGEGGAGR